MTADTILSMLTPMLPAGDLRDSTTALRKAVVGNKEAEAAFKDSLPVLKEQVAAYKKGKVALHEGLRKWLTALQSGFTARGQKSASLATAKLDGAIGANPTGVDKALKGVISFLPF